MPIAGTIQGYGGNGTPAAGIAIGTTTTDAGLTLNQKRFYTGVMIKRMLPELEFLGQDAIKQTIPENSGGFTDNSIRFVIQGNALPLATTALVEGEPPTPSTLDWREKGARLAQYGGVAKHSDILEHAGMSNVVTQIAEALGEQAGRTIHALQMNIILGGTNVLYGGGVAGRANLDAANAAHRMTVALIKRAARDLRRLGVPTFPDGTYHAVLSMDQLYDLQDDTAYQAMNGFQFAPSAAGSGASDGSFLETTRIHGVSIRSSVHNTTVVGGHASAPNVHQGVVYGPNAFGFFDHSAWKVPTIDRKTGRGVRIYMVPADRESKEDPLGQIGVLGWKVAWGGVILDQRKIVRLETVTSLNQAALTYLTQDFTSAGTNALAGT